MLTKPVWNAVLKRDMFRCVLCGTSNDLTVDHIIPRCHGGTDDPTNLQALCRRCNSRKGKRTMVTLACLRCRVPNIVSGAPADVASYVDDHGNYCSTCGGEVIIVARRYVPLDMQAAERGDWIRERRRQLWDEV